LEGRDRRGPAFTDFLFILPAAGSQPAAAIIFPIKAGVFNEVLAADADSMVIPTLLLPVAPMIKEKKLFLDREISSVPAGPRWS
jgi:hypothetical protein